MIIDEAKVKCLQVANMLNKTLQTHVFRIIK